MRLAADVEAEFLADHEATSRPRVRAALALGVLAVLGFGLYDFFRDGASWHAPDDLVRFGVELPLALLALALTAPGIYERWFRVAIQFIAPVFGIALVFTATVAADAQGLALASARLVLLTFFIWFMLGMTFFAALRTNLVVVASFAWVSWQFRLPLTAAGYDFAVLLCANVFAGAGAWWLEAAIRSAFLERRRLAEVARLDGLTGLLNRAAFDTEFRRVWDQAARDRGRVTVLMLDIDHFKAFNDRYGHQAGDDTLRAVGRVLRGVARRPLDIAARYGGEELVAVLPGADREHADHVARALVEAVSGLGVAHEASPTRGCVTASVGAACVEAVRELSNEAALRLADRALYQAKDAGRDRHVLLDPDFTAASPLPRPAV
jgi:diguanylate cyclase (GGDEF)-like protein